MITISNNFQAIALDSSHEDEVSQLICETFMTEPLTVASKISHNAFLPFCRNTFRDAVKNQLAFGAIEQGSKEIAAYWICEEDRSFSDTSQTPPPLDTAELEPIFELLGRVHEMVPTAAKEIFGIQDITSEKILHMFMVGVRQKYLGRGVASFLTQEVLHFAKERGFTLVVVEATNPGSQVPLLKLGFSQGGEVLYDSPPFEKVSDLYRDRPYPCDRCLLLIKRL